MLSLCRKVLLGLSLSLLAVANVSLAAPILLQGDHFAVTYDSVQAGIYGAGAVSGSGDTVYFLPTTFTAFSGVAGGAVNSSATLQLTLTADPGYVFTGLSFSERGDYLLFGGGAVNVGASIEVTNVATSASDIHNLSPGVPLNLVGVPTHNWELGGDLSLQGLGVSQILQITLDNTLFASTPTAGMGFIEKKFAGFKLVTEQGLPPVAVPEPSSWSLLLAGVLAAWLAGRRRSKCAPGRTGVGNTMR